jgi:hypothetical protein
MMVEPCADMCEASLRPTTEPRWEEEDVLATAACFEIPSDLSASTCRGGGGVRGGGEEGRRWEGCQNMTGGGWGGEDGGDNNGTAG